MDLTLDDRWYLIKKDVYEGSRAVMPGDLTQQGLIFPPAILCGYTFSPNIMLAMRSFGGMISYGAIIPIIMVIISMWAGTMILMV